MKRCLAVTELDTFKIEDTLTVCQDQSIERQDFKHLERCDQSASALLDHVVDGGDAGGLASEWSSYGGVTKFHDGSLLSLLQTELLTRFFGG